MNLIDPNIIMNLTTPPQGIGKEAAMSKMRAWGEEWAEEEDLPSTWCVNHHHRHHHHHHHHHHHFQRNISLSAL